MTSTKEDLKQKLEVAEKEITQAALNYNNFIQSYRKNRDRGVVMWADELCSDIRSVERNITKASLAHGKALEEYNTFCKEETDPCEDISTYTLENKFISLFMIPINHNTRTGYDCTCGDRKAEWYNICNILQLMGYPLNTQTYLLRDRIKHVLDALRVPPLSSTSREIRIVVKRDKQND